ncbi:cupin domain-containing protein [Ottowia thiooxydans]|uniref:Transcriptional regulator with XRE-family HTH domain n=1 Tax=Ottowia thiooxydans TaxID=219182 RepID=A0ABV2Q2L4_9BURK
MDITRNLEITLGPRLRALRQQRKISLMALAKASGKSVGYVSQVERGISSPTLRELSLFSEVLGVDMVSLLTDTPSADTHPPVRRDADRSFIPFRGEQTRKRVLTPRNEGVLKMYVMQIEPGGSSGDALYTHEGEEAGYVLAGEIVLNIAETEYRLAVGDSFRFSSTTPHAFRNVGNTLAEVVWVNVG